METADQHQKRRCRRLMHGNRLVATVWNLMHHDRLRISLSDASLRISHACNHLIIHLCVETILPMSMFRINASNATLLCTSMTTFERPLHRA